MNLFAYGTLLVPEIWLAVTGRECESVVAMLPGYDIRRVRGGDFPGILHAEGASVPGRVFLDLDEEIIARLDCYEDTFYERLEVTTQDAQGHPLTAQAYVVPANHAEVLSDEGWTLDWFRQHAQSAYMTRLFNHYPVPDTE